MRAPPTLSHVEQMIRAARSAVRCRHAAYETHDPATADALMRAAARYSGLVADVADEMLRELRAR